MLPLILKLYGWFDNRKQIHKQNGKDFSSSMVTVENSNNNGLQPISDKRMTCTKKTKQCWTLATLRAGMRRERGLVLRQQRNDAFVSRVTVLTTRLARRHAGADCHRPAVRLALVRDIEHLLSVLVVIVWQHRRGRHDVSQTQLCARQQCSRVRRARIVFSRRETNRAMTDCNTAIVNTFRPNLSSSKII